MGGSPWLESTAPCLTKMRRRAFGATAEIPAAERTTQAATTIAVAVVAPMGLGVTEGV